MSLSQPRAAIVTVSDRASRGEYEDKGGPGCEDWLRGVVTTPLAITRHIIPDGRESVGDTLRALVAEEVPGALDRLKKAVAAHKAATPQPARPAQKEDGEKEEIPIDLAQRALPLIQLLEAAAAAKADVLWDHQ